MFLHRSTLPGLISSVAGRDTLRQLALGTLDLGPLSPRRLPKDREEHDPAPGRDEVGDAHLVLAEMQTKLT
jgi:hypothetical protein